MLITTELTWILYRNKR